MTSPLIGSVGPLKKQNKAKSLCLTRSSQSRFLQQSCMRMRLHWLSSRSQGPLPALSSPHTSALQLNLLMNMVYRDINPQAPVHFLVIPKNRDGLTQLSKCSDRHEPLLGHLIRVASKVALQGELTCLHALLTMPCATQAAAWHCDQTRKLVLCRGMRQRLPYGYQ